MSPKRAFGKSSSQLTHDARTPRSGDRSAEALAFSGTPALNLPEPLPSGLQIVARPGNFSAATPVKRRGKSMSRRKGRWRCSSAPGISDMVAELSRDLLG